MRHAVFGVVALVGCADASGGGGSTSSGGDETSAASSIGSTTMSTTSTTAADESSTGADTTGGDTGGDDGPAGPLVVDVDNPCYFNDGARIVYLTGSHTWGNNRDRALEDPPTPFEYDLFLDFAEGHGHNFFRLWTWEQAHSWNNNTDGEKRWFLPQPWLRTGPALANDGKPAFDLEQLDPAYFDRLRDRVVRAGERGFYVSVMLFDGWDLANAYNPDDGGFPYGAGNNVNGIAIDGPGSQSLVDDQVTAIQEAYVKRLIDTVNDLDNVLYEIANETGSYGVDWQYHMIDLVRGYEGTLPHQHPIGMTATFPGSDVDLFDSNADWISPASQLIGCDGTKVVVNDTDHSYYWTALKADGQDAHRIWVWRTATIGAQPLFMDPYLEVWGDRNAPDGDAPDPYWDTMRDAMGRARSYVERLDLRTARHDGSACSTGYCIAEYGAQYLAYQDGSGPFTVSVQAGTYAYEWYDPNAGTIAEMGSIDLPTEDHEFTPPFDGDAVLLLLAR
jgi:hypothetical protein